MFLFSGEKMIQLKERREKKKKKLCLNKAAPEEELFSQFAPE